MYEVHTRVLYMKSQNGRGGGGRSNGPYADSLPLSSHFQGGGGSRTPTYMV